MALVDGILARYQMRWELNPYRIVNKHDIVVQKKHFDLREKVLKAQENIGSNRFKTKKEYPST